MTRAHPAGGCQPQHRRAEHDCVDGGFQQDVPLDRYGRRIRRIQRCCHDARNPTTPSRCQNGYENEVRGSKRNASPTPENERVVPAEDLRCEGRERPKQQQDAGGMQESEVPVRHPAFGEESRRREIDALVEARRRLRSVGDEERKSPGGCAEQDDHTKDDRPLSRWDARPEDRREGPTVGITVPPRVLSLRQGTAPSLYLRALPPRKYGDPQRLERKPSSAPSRSPMNSRPRSDADPS
jgi:hypothetical protein